MKWDVHIKKNGSRVLRTPVDLDKERCWCGLLKKGRNLHMDGKFEINQCLF